MEPKLDSIKLRQIRRIFDYALFSILLLSFSFFYQGGFANQNSRFDLSLALAFEHTFSIDTFHTNTIDKVLSEGRYFTEKAPGASYLALPIPLLASIFYTTEDLLNKPHLADILLYFSTIFSVALLSSIAAVYFRRLLCRINPARSDLEATLLTAAVFMGSLMFPYSTMLFGHQLAAAFLICAIYYGIEFSSEPSHKAASGAASAFFFGMAVFSEYPTAVLASILAIPVVLAVKSRTDLLKAAGFALIPAGLLLLHNYLSFGNPFSLGYGKLEGTQFASQMSQGFFGVRLPTLPRVIQLLFGLYRGLLVYCPILILAAASYYFWPKPIFRKYGVALISAATLGLLLNASYGYWQGGVCFGPRHLVPIIPLIGLGLAFLPGKWLKSLIFIFVVAISVAINTIGTTVTPFVDEYDTNPLFNSYADLLHDNSISANPLHFLTPQWEIGHRWHSIQEYPTASFNLGELIGLHGWLSLLPLLTAWLLFIVFIVRASRHAAAAHCAPPSNTIDSFSSQSGTHS